MQGAAVKAGMLITRGQSALFMDADGATKVSDVEKLEAELQRSSSGMALAQFSNPVHLKTTVVHKRQP